MSHFSCAPILNKTINHVDFNDKMSYITKTLLVIVVIRVVKWVEMQ
jgi:hypothetical protein